MTTTVGARAPVPAEVRERLDGRPAGSQAWEPACADPGYLAVVHAAVAGAAEAWDVGVDSSGAWLRVEPAAPELPPQGWKLHVSTTVTRDRELLEAVAPLLVDRGVAWKVAASPSVLSGLNQGEAGLSQIGKFLTVYPRDDREAVALAVALDEALADHGGPRVPSDRRVRRGSVVSYRYGGFDDRTVTGPLGELLPAISDPSGRLVPDLRGATFDPPPWTVDPFAEAGLGEPDAPRLVGDRYLLTSVLSRSPRGTVSLAVDLDSRRACVVKHAAAGAAHSPWGRDALDLLRHEHESLRLLAGHRAVPSVLGWVETEDEAWLVLEQVPGEPLTQHVARRANAGHPADLTQVLSWCEDLVDALEHLHARGLVYRDLKAGNVILGPDGVLRLVDFEMTLDVGTPGDGSLGSRGYCSPQQVAGEPAATTDDVYGLGALLYFALTGAEPALAPDPFDLASRAVLDLAPTTPVGVADVVAECLDIDPDRRPAARDVTTALRSAVCGAVTAPVVPEETPRCASAPQAPDAAFTDERIAIARRLADSLARATRRWSERGVDLATVDVSLYSGAAGELFALAELMTTLEDPSLSEALQAGAAALRELPTEPGTGLYHGDAGVGLALLRTGLALGDPSLTEAGADRVSLATASPASGLDLVSGVAGQARACLLADAVVGADATGGRLSRLVAVLRSQAVMSPAGLSWREQDVAYLGYAHGTAGIADVLLDTAEATDREELLVMAGSAAAYLLFQARPHLPDGAGLAWPDVEGGDRTTSLWCHGATGITGFLAHAAAATGNPDLVAAVGAGLRTVTRSRSALGPVLCHGLAGSLELVLDVQGSVRDADARSLVRLLDAFAWATRDGLVYLDDSPTQVSPALMTGYAGIALTQLRLADPTRPRALSPAAVRTWAGS